MSIPQPIDTIRVSGLRRTFPPHSNGARDVNFTAAAGEITSLLGANGSGKTTTLRVLTGILACESGLVQLLGETMTTGNCPLKARIAYLPDSLSLSLDMTGREYALFVAHLYGLRGRSAQTAVDASLDRVGASSFADLPFGACSHGMTQRLLLASALSHPSEVVILDEPMNGLDPVSARMVKDLLKALADEGRAVLVSTHLLPLAEEMSARIVVLHEGRTLYQGAPSALVPDGGTFEDGFLELLAGTRRDTVSDRCDAVQREAQ